MTSVQDCTFICDIFSNYRLHSHIHISVYVSDFKNINNETKRFLCEIIHKMLKYFYKIPFRYAMQILTLQIKMTMSTVYIYGFVLFVVFFRYFQCYRQHNKNIHFFLL